MKKMFTMVLAGFSLVASAAEAVTDFPVEMLGDINGMAFPRTSLLTTGGLVKGVADGVVSTLLERWASTDDIVRKRFFQAVGELLEIADKKDFAQLARDFGYEIFDGSTTSRKIYITGFYSSNPPTANNAVSRMYSIALDPINNALNKLNDLLSKNWYGKSFKLDISIAGVNLLSSLADVDIDVDRGDVMMVRGILKMLKCLLYFGHGFDFTMELDDILAALGKFGDDCQVRGMDPIAAFDASPLARTKVTSVSDLQTARTLFGEAVSDLTAGVNLLYERTDTSKQYLLSSDDAICGLVILVATYKDVINAFLNQLISPANLSSAQVATGSLELMYTGMAISPVIGVATANSTAVPYELTGTTVATNAGTYSVTLVGYGRSTGTKTISWKIVSPSVSGDSGAKVEVGKDGGYVITPSADRTEQVEVSLPSGVSAEQVTVKVSPEVKSVKLNGAKLCISRSANDITSYLDIPAPDAQGTIDLTKVVVKEEIVREALDTTKDAVVELTSAEPTITTAKTRPGLVYTLVEGTTLGGMGAKDSKVGDGQPWTPKLTVKGGSSGFYSIRVTK